MDKVKLIKLLNLTTSNNDAEALSAIRAANRMLNSQLWDTVMTGHGNDPDLQRKAHRLEREKLDLMIEITGLNSKIRALEGQQSKPPKTASELLEMAGLAAKTDKQREWVNKFDFAYKQHGCLSERQAEILENIITGIKPSSFS